MKKSKITMICREIWRAEVYLEYGEKEDLENVKDRAWAQFDANKSKDLEQENYTKVEVLTRKEPNES